MKQEFFDWELTELNPWHGEVCRQRPDKWAKYDVDFHQAVHMNILLTGRNRMRIGISELDFNGISCILTSPWEPHGSFYEYNDSIHFMSVLHPENTLNACRQMSEPAYFKERLPVLEKILPVGEPVLVEWYVKSRTAEGLRRMAAQCPEIVLAEALKPSTGTEEYQFISEQVRQANPALVVELEIDRLREDPLPLQVLIRLALRSGDLPEIVGTPLRARLLPARSGSGIDLLLLE